MIKTKRYIGRYLGRSIEMSRANSATLVYRIPYQNLSIKDEVFTIENQFIVYILYGKNDAGRDVIYVGKSKNGLKNRPTAHENKYNKWLYCYILTQLKERTFFNDGAIQFLENRLNHIVNDLGTFENTTNKTNSGTANRNDEEDCEDYLEEALQMLDVLGLDLITHRAVEDSDNDVDYSSGDCVVPNGIYHMNRKLKRLGGRAVKALMEVNNGRFIVLKGSMVCMLEGPGLLDNVIVKRTEARIVDGVLKDDIVFDSPSAAGSFVIGASCNGWVNWRDEKNVAIDQYRQHE